MKRDDLRRWEQELTQLVPIEGASPLACNDAFAFNDDAKDAMDALRAAARDGSQGRDVDPVVERRFAELAFWRRVLVDVHRGELASGQGRPEVLVQYLLS